jgi:hypothetical protein
VQKHKRLVGILAVSSFLLFGAPARARAQTPLVTLAGDMEGEYFGFAVSAAGDVDADGVPDYVVGSDIHTSGSKGRVWIYSGATHQVLHTLEATWTGGFKKVSLAPAGDFDLDGHDDVLVGVPAGNLNRGMALIVSGLDGSVLHTFSGAAFEDGFGESVGNAGDVNGDGRPDLIIGVPYRDVGGVENVGAAVVYSGADASLLLTFVGTTYTGFLGSAVNGIGDVDGDEHDDVAIGERTATASGPGKLHIRSGFDGSLIRVHSGSSLGRNVVGLGDVNRDGVPDYAAGCPFSFPPSAGHVWVFSGLDGSLLHEFAGQVVGETFGCAIASAGDVDGDSVSDILIGAQGQQSTTGRAELYSGSDWSRLQTFSGDVLQDLFGKSVAGVGDTNGDSVPDVLIGYDGSSKTTFEPGAVRLYSGLDFAPWFTYCEALPNSSYATGAAISYVGSPSLSDANLDLVVNWAVKNSVGLFLYGPAQQQTPFGNGYLCVGAGGVGVFRLQPFVTGISHGGISLDFSQPPLSGGPGMITPGSTWNFQAWYRDTPAGGAGFNLSNALSATFVP